MYDPFALDRIRLEQESLRRRVARAPRRPAPRREATKPVTESAAEAIPSPRLRLAFAGVFHRKGSDSKPCTDC